MSNNFPIKKYFSLKNFFLEYRNNIQKSLLNVDLNKIEMAAEIIEKKIKNNNNIFVCGNGGSASIANHYVTDFTKMLRTKTKLKPKLFSLNSNSGLISAISNDIGYESVFTYQAETYCKKSDLIIIISSSGNSKNIINLVKFAKKKRIKKIGFCGFKGGNLNNNSDINIHINTNNYGLVEDCHHILMHSIAQYIRQKNIKSKVNRIIF